MSPRFASSATKEGSLLSSPLWKRVFSRQRTSPSSRVRNVLVISNSAEQREQRCTVSGTRLLQQFPHRDGRVRHPVGKAPFIVVPRHHPHQRAVLHFGLIHMEGGRMRIVIEVDRDVGRGGVAQDAL